jgi:hypothetical protein
MVHGQDLDLVSTNQEFRRQKVRHKIEFFEMIRGRAVERSKDIRTNFTMWQANFGTLLRRPKAFASPLPPICRTLASYRQMLDLGGAPSAPVESKLVNTAKNLAIQAVCFDFRLLIYSSVSVPASSSEIDPDNSSHPVPPLRIEPDLEKVQGIANLLNVELGGTSRGSARSPEFQDDLSLLLDEADLPEILQSRQQGTVKAVDNHVALKQGSSDSHAGTDIRAKYAQRLMEKGVTGGAAELARNDKQQDSGKLDAKSHFAARAAAMAAPLGPKLSSDGDSAVASRWMALNETGSLLGALCERSIRLALLPLPLQTSLVEVRKEWQEMNQFRHQLPPSIKFHYCGHAKNAMDQNGEDRSKILATLETSLINRDASAIVGEILASFDDIKGRHIMFVTDRDDYIRAAKEANMTTCRLRVKPNAPRGNTSPHYTITSISEVRDIVDEMNGISYTTTAVRNF